MQIASKLIILITALIVSGCISIQPNTRTHREKPKHEHGFNVWNHYDREEINNLTKQRQHTPKGSALRKRVDARIDELRNKIKERNEHD